MYRINSRESSAATEAYYTEKARQDYYSEGLEILGNWGGKGAERLGLKGTVDRDAFIALCRNINPATGGGLTPRTRIDRTCSWDQNFHCPKSVSVVYAWNHDTRIMEAFRRAVQETMEELERETRTRVRKDGKPDGDRVTGNLIWAEYVHLTARPEGQVPDPHLHAHCVTFNATFDEIESRWKAAQFREIMRRSPYSQAAFFARLANYLVEAGYRIRRVDKAFEIEGVPDAVIRQFSKRTARIVKTKKERGITDPKIADKLGAWTRNAKNTDLSFTELRGIWREAVVEENRVKMDGFLRLPVSRQLGRSERPKISEAPREPLAVHDNIPQKRGKGAKTLGPGSAISLLGSKEASATTRRKTPPDPGLEREALDRSILHNFYRASVVTEWDILAHAMRLTYGSGLTPEGLCEAMKRHPEFIFREMDGIKWVTTQSVLAEERANVKWVKEGMGTLSPIITGHKIADEKLNDEQRAAVLHVLSSKDRVTAVEGKSGTGKTWLMKEAVAAVEAEHLPVLVLAPETPAVQETLRKGAFPNAQTVQQLLVNEKLQDQYRNGVWWVDEAGQLSARSMHQLFELAQKQGARIVFSADIGQHRAVERGDALRVLYEFADLKPAFVTKILRQTGKYRENMELLSQGRVREGFLKMDAEGCIHEIPFETRYKAIAQMYVKSAKEKGRPPLVVAPTHFEGRLVTEEIRTALKAEGQLKDERPVEVLKEIDMSPADRADWRTYRPGWIIELIRATPGTQAGTRMVIDSIDYETGNIYVKKPSGATHNWDVRMYEDRFQVYQADVEMLAAGDRIRITKGGRTEYGRSKVFRGSVYTLTGFDQFGDLKLDNGMVLSRDFSHLAHGYARTSHGAQSRTVKHVIVAESSVSFGAASREQFYVSTSRGIDRMDVVTNNKAELLDAVQPSSQRRSAMELVEKTPSPKPLPEDYREELQRAQKRADEMLRQRNEEQERQTREPSAKQQRDEKPEHLKPHPKDEERLKAEMSHAEPLRERVEEQKEIEPEIEF